MTELVMRFLLPLVVATGGAVLIATSGDLATVRGAAGFIACLWLAAKIVGSAIVDENPILFASNHEWWA